MSAPAKGWAILQDRLLQFEGEDACASDDEHERDTVRAPPPVEALHMRDDETPRVVMTPASEAFRTASGTITTPAPSRTRSVASRMRAATSRSFDTGRVSDTRRVSDDDETLRVKLDPARIEQDAGLRIPPLHVSRDLQALAQSLSATPDGRSSSPPAMQSLSPTERSRPESPRRARAMLWPAMTAALLVAFGASALLRQMASPRSEPRHATRAPAVAPTRGTSVQHTVPAALLEPKPADAATVTAHNADTSPLPKARRASLRLLRPDDAALPETPGRDEVLAAMTPLRDAIRECADGRGGVAELDLSVASSGAVLNALVHGDYAGTPQGSCIARAARKASFAPFRRDRFRVLYPMSL